MKYENYERKIRAMKLAKDMIHSVRFWIIGTVSVAAVTTGTLTGVKGITTVENMPAKITYGETYSPTSTALMSSSVLEYAREGSNEWSITQPTFVGQYKVRSVSTNGVGATYYSAEEHFEIVPKPVEFNISSTAITYGENPMLGTYSLVGDDALEGYKISVKDVDLENGICTGTFDDSAFVITDKNNNDVTFCYDITGLEKALKFNKRSLAITVGGATKEYDGTPLSSDEYEVLSGTLASGDQLFMGDSVQVTEVSKVENTRTVTIKNEAGEDVSKYYDITPTYGELEVTKRNITVSSNSVARQYDGTDLSDELTTFITNGSLLSGDALEVSFTEANQVKPTTETKTNGFSYDIVDGSGHSVLSRYEVTVDPGTIEIAKREVSYTTEGVDKTYDGKSFSSSDVTITSQEGLAQGDEFVKSTALTFCDPTEEGAKNVITLDVYNADGQNVTDCYDFNPTYGDCTINKRTLKFVMPSLTNEYDGVEHAIDETCDFSMDASFGAGLLQGHNPILVDPMIALEAHIYGDEAHPDTSKVRIVDQDLVDVSNYYDIQYVRSTSLITPRELTVEANDISTEYTGENIFTKDQEVAAETGYSILSGSVADADKIEAKYTSSAWDAGSDEYEIEVDIVNKFSSVQRASNYTLTVLPGNYDITKPNLYFRTKDYTKTYDGTSNLPSVQKDVLWEVVGPLSAQDYVSVEPIVKTTGINASDEKYDLTISNQSKVQIKKQSSSIITTDNYNIFFQEYTGHLQIDKIHLTVEPNDIEFTYDGQKRKVQGTWESEVEGKHTGNFSVIGTLADGDKLSIGNGSTDEVYLYEHTGTDVTFNNPVVNNKSGADVSSNYQISASEGLEYKVNKRPITIYTATAVGTYNNQYLVKNELIWESATINNNVGLADGDWIDMDEVEWPTKSEYATCRPINCSDNNNGAKNKNTVGNIVIKNIDDEDVTSSYDIEMVFGSLYLNRLTIGISYGSVTKEYNGKAFNNSEFSLSYTSTSNGAFLYHDANFGNIPEDFHVYGHVDSSETTNFIDAGTYLDLSSHLYFSVKTNDGTVLCADSRTDTHENFVFSLSTQTANLTITQKALTIKNYGFKSLYFDGITAIETKSVTGLVANDKLYLKPVGDIAKDTYTTADLADLEAYESGKTNYTLQSDFGAVGTGKNEYGVSNYVVLRNNGDGTYKNITSSYNITEIAGDYSITQANY